MKFFFSVLALSLLLFVSTIESRNQPAKHENTPAKDQPAPKQIQRYAPKGYNSEGVFDARVVADDGNTKTPESSSATPSPNDHDKMITVEVHIIEVKIPASLLTSYVVPNGHNISPSPFYANAVPKCNTIPPPYNTDAAPRGENPSPFNREDAGNNNPSPSNTSPYNGGYYGILRGKMIPSPYNADSGVADLKNPSVNPSPKDFSVPNEKIPPIYTAWS